MSEENRVGYYRDHAGKWQPDRRKGGPDRRTHSKEKTKAHEGRKQFRRQVDRELYETDHKVAMKEALEDFAEEHGGQV